MKNLKPFNSFINEDDWYSHPDKFETPELMQKIEVSLSDMRKHIVLDIKGSKVELTSDEADDLVDAITSAQEEMPD